MWNRAKREALPYFNPRLGKATIDVGVLSELTVLQIAKWKELHKSVLDEITTTESLISSLNAFTRNMEVGRDGIQVFKDVHKAASGSKELLLEAISNAVKDLKGIFERYVKPLQVALQRCKTAHKKRQQAAMRKNRDDLQIQISSLEVAALERQLFQDFPIGRAAVTTAVSKHMQRYAKAVLDQHRTGAKQLRVHSEMVNRLGDQLATAARIEKKRAEGEVKAAISNLTTPSTSAGARLRGFTNAQWDPQPVPPPEPPKYPGEGIILKVDKATCVIHKQHTIGTLWATNYRAIFLPYLAQMPKDNQSLPWFNMSRKHESKSANIFSSGARNGNNLTNMNVWFECPWLAVSKMEKAGNAQLTIIRKDLLTHTLNFAHASTDSQRAFKTFETLLWGTSSTKGGEPDVKQFFAYWHYKDAVAPNGGSSASAAIAYALPGWLDWKSEYERLGIPDKKCWVLYNNKHFSLSPTYPESLVVPSTLYSHQITKVADFRSKKRFPILCWRLLPSQMGRFRRKVCLRGGEEAKVCAGFDKPFTFPERTPCLLRCAQPQSGLTGRCEVEEAMFHWVGLYTSPYSKAKNLAVLDCRPKINAMANIAKGGGWESEEHYKTTTLEFLNIANIHAVREAFVSLNKAFRRLDPHTNPGGRHERYRPIVESLASGKEGWWELLLNIMKGSNKVVEYMTVQYTSVLIHCSDGWDRTPQITGLSQLQMDPFYRTVEGFSRIVEKEFIGFGHAFAKRSGHGSKRLDATDSNRSPIFLQWIDCVYQLIRQFPEHFEFSPMYLVRVADAVHSGLFGNFLFNTEKQRKNQFLRASTLSLWPTLRDDPALRNPKYVGASVDKAVLVSCTTRADLQLFLPFFSRWDPRATPTPIAIPSKVVLDLTAEGKDKKGGHRRATVSNVESPLLKPQQKGHILKRRSSTPAVRPGLISKSLPRRRFSPESKNRRIRQVASLKEEVIPPPPVRVSKIKVRKKNKLLKNWTTKMSAKPRLPSRKGRASLQKSLTRTASISDSEPID